MTPTILIVDDSPAIHQIVSSCCVNEPWRICSAYRGVEGLEMAASRGAELVLLDIDLPDMNGFDICRFLKAGPATARSAIIFLTSSCSTDEKVCGLQLGACDYMTKPFRPAELIERVRGALQRKPMLDRIPVFDNSSPLDRKDGFGNKARQRRGKMRTTSEDHWS